MSLLGRRGFFLFWLGVMALLRAQECRLPRVALPLMQQAPDIDGEIGNDEWKGAGRVTGLYRLGRDLLCDRGASFWIGCDGEFFFFAVQSELPPDGKLVSTIEKAKGAADPPVIRDDCIEVWVAPGGAAKGNVFQGLFNARGAIYDEFHPTGRPWRGRWRVASGFHGGYWHFEGALPLASMGIKGSITGQVWRMRLARNWKRPGLQAPWAPVVSDFADTESMARVQWLETGVVCQALSIRGKEDSTADARIELFNPAKVRQTVRVRLQHQPSDSQHTLQDEALELEPGEAREVQLIQQRLGEQETVYTSMEATSPDGRTVYFRRDVRWKVPRTEKRWRLLRPEEAGLARFRKGMIFYSSFDKGKDADLAAGKGEARIIVRDGGKFQLTEGVSGRALLSGRAGAMLSYPNAGNFSITEGTLSLWARAVNWTGVDPKASTSHSFFMNGWPGRGYFGIQVARQLSKVPYIQFYLIQYPNRPVESLVYRSGVVDWSPKDWHWLVLTWKGRTITLYVDGDEVGKTALDPPLGPDLMTSEAFRIGISGGTEQTAIDEVRIWSHAFSMQELRQARVFCRNAREAATWETVDLKIAYYPYYSKLRARVDISGLGSRQQVTGADVRLREFGKKRALKQWRLENFKEFLAEGTFETGELPAGQYEVALRLVGEGKLPTGEKTVPFTREQFPWEHNRLGISDRLLPPFTPLRVQGRSVFSILREHQMNDLGLWEQVVAKGNPILAGPMRFQIRMNGGELRPRAEPLRFTKKADNRAVAEATWRAGPISGSMTSEYDYDGMMLCTLELEQEGTANIEQFDLVIPLRADVARLMHACGERTRFNYSGKVPAGEGRVWDSSKVRRYALLTPFAPYVWVGGTERGLCWFADNDRGWVIDPERPAQELFRGGQILELRVHLVQKPAPLGRPRRIVFGLQATPIKPMPEKPANWRRWTFVTSKDPALYCIQLGSSHYSGRMNYEPYPYNHDLSIWQKIADARKTGKVDRAFLDKWLARLPESIRKDKEQLEFYRRANLAGQFMASRQPDRLFTYMNARGANYAMPEFQTFQDEWHIADFTKRQWRSRFRAGVSYGIAPTESFQDFTLWYLKQQRDLWLDGLYYDNCFLAANRDPVTSSAYRFPDGRIQPSVSLMNLRRLIKRTAVLFHESGRAPLIGPHMTNTAYMPVMAFGSLALDLEWQYGMADFQDRFSRDLLQVQTLGRQAGCTPLFCGHGSRGRNFARVQRARHTMNGVSLVHELKPVWYGRKRPPKGTLPPPGKEPFLRYKETMEMLYDFGYGGPEVKTWNYWQKDFPLEIEGADLAGIVHQGKGKAIIILTDYGKGGKAKVTVNATALALSRPLQLTDWEARSPLPIKGQAFEIEFQPHAYRVLILEPLAH